MRQQERATRLRPVFEYVSQNFAENLTLKQGAALASISQPQFIKLFKRVAVIVELWTPCTKTLEETLALERAWAPESLHYLSTLASESLGPPF